jgi:hypothetical protein
MTAGPTGECELADPYDVAELARCMAVTPATARRYLRRAITLPDGRKVYGWPPGAAHGRLLEHQLRDKLAAQLGGITEAVLPYGRADVLTATAVFEVERHRSWRHGAQQVLAYSAQTGLPPAVALFGPIHHDDLLSLYLKLRGDPYHGNAGALALWWWNGYGWEHVSSRTRCRNMPAPRDQQDGGSHVRKDDAYDRESCWRPG